MIKNSINITVLLTLINTMLILLMADGLVSPATFMDDGAASYVNIALLLAGVGYSLWLGLSAFADRRLDWFCLAFVYQMYLAREADLHRVFIDYSLTNWKTYLLPEVPALLKISSILLLAILFMSMSYLISRYIGVIFTALKKKAPWAVSFGIWFVLLFSAQFIDRKLPTEYLYTAVEEMFEVGAAVFALLALTQFVSHYSNKYKDYFS